MATTVTNAVISRGRAVLQLSGRWLPQPFDLGLPPLDCSRKLLCNLRSTDSGCFKRVAKFPKLASADGVLTVLVIGPCRVSGCGCGLVALAGRLFLLTGCALGACHLCHSQLKQVFAVVFVVKLNGFCRFYFKILSGAFGASGCLLGVSWVPPG